jgi:hypothetical protein
MATRSTISIKENGKIRSIYCHWDGYPSNNGAILLEHYTTSEKINELINLGAISCLKDNVNPDPTSSHSFDNSQENVVIAYIRDRGEDSDERLIIDEYTNQKDIKGEEYDYLFVDGVWKVRDSKNFIKLTRKMCELD